MSDVTILSQWMTAPMTRAMSLSCNDIECKILMVLPSTAVLQWRNSPSYLSSLDTGCLDNWCHHSNASLLSLQIVKMFYGMVADLLLETATLDITTQTLWRQPASVVLMVFQQPVKANACKLASLILSWIFELQLVVQRQMSWPLVNSTTHISISNGNPWIIICGNLPHSTTCLQSPHLECEPVDCVDPLSSHIVIEACHGHYYPRMVSPLGLTFKSEIIYCTAMPHLENLRCL